MTAFGGVRLAEGPEESRVCSVFEALTNHSLGPGNANRALRLIVAEPDVFKSTPCAAHDGSDSSRAPAHFRALNSVTESHAAS